MIVMIRPAKEMSTSKSWNSSSYVTTFTSPPPSGKDRGQRRITPCKRGITAYASGSARFRKEPCLFYQMTGFLSKPIFDKPTARAVGIFVLEVHFQYK